MAKSAAALIVAAGRGSRLADADNPQPKQYRLLGGRPVLSHTLNAVANHPAISRVVTVIHPDDSGLYEDAVAATGPLLQPKLQPAVFGDATRQQSVCAGLEALEDAAPDYVLIHDAARPFLPCPVIDRLLQALDGGAEGALAAIPVNDTLKRAGATGQSLETVDRTGLWAAQTPQAFPFRRILSAHAKAKAAGRLDFTDDTGLAEWDGMSILLTEGDPSNFKITTAADLRRAEQLARIMHMTGASVPLAQLADIRSGIGYDVHAFEDGDAVILGGVAIPHSKRLKGHSDADVVLHAITDATLGAIGDGDIGKHFPPSDTQWKGASSDRFQQDAQRRLAALGGRIAHIDVTIVCEEPKIGPHREDIRRSLAAICGVAVTRISVKATTSERLGFTGRKEGIAALASVTVRLPLSDDE